MCQRAKVDPYDLIVTEKDGLLGSVLQVNTDEVLLQRMTTQNLR